MILEISKVLTASTAHITPMMMATNPDLVHAQFEQNLGAHFPSSTK